jgi:hypothetical protein
MLDEALQMALENFEAGDSLGLLYTRFEGHRCLAEVRLRRGEIDEAERICATTSDFVSNTESRVSQLWLGPLYIDVLIAAAGKADRENKPDESAAKRELARSLLTKYQDLVSQCQSPRFTREAQRLATALA